MDKHEQHESTREVTVRGTETVTDSILYCVSKLFKTRPRVISHAGQTVVMGEIGDVPVKIVISPHYR